MKKSLLLASFAALALCANAETVVVLATTEDFDAVGLTSTKADFPGGTTVVSNPEVGSFGLAYQDSWGVTSTYKNFRNVKFFDGEEIVLGSGAVGNANPTFTYYEDGVMSGGAVFEIKPLKDGFCTVFTKINPNKQYLVFEGKTGMLAFTLGWATTDGQKIYYTTPHDEDWQIDFNAPDASKYFIAGTKQQTNEAGVPLWVNKTDASDIVAADAKPTSDYVPLNEDIPGTHKPQFPYLVAGMETAPGESTGFLTFSVIEGETYRFSALGSKAACGGFVFTDEEPTITFIDPAGEGNDVVFQAGNTAVESVIAPTLDENAPIYNTQGVRVGADAKGILIQNGKKFVRF